MKLRQGVTLLTAAALAVTLAACTPGTPDDSASPGPGTGQIDPNGTLTYGYNTSLSSFDPHRATLSQDNVWLFATYDRLVHETAAGESVPGLASEWAFADDGLSLTMNLREGVDFHDGTPFNAEAVKANIERGKTLPDSIVASDLGVIDSVEVLGDYEVKINLTGPAPHVVAILSDRGGAMISPAAFENSDLGLQPVGAGMFEVTEYVPGSSATYERHEGYWDADAAAVQSLKIVLVEDPNAGVNALRSGQLDWTGVRVTDVATFESDPEFEIELFTNLGYYYVMLNRDREYVDDVRVRQAMSYAIDQEAFNTILGGGVSVPCDQVFPPGYFAHDTTLGCDSYGYDPDKARDLMAEAGYADGITIPMTVGNIPVMLQAAEFVQAQFKEVGINLDLRTVEAAQAGASFLVEKENDMFMGYWGGRPSPFQTLALLYGENGLNNPGGHRSEAFEAAYAKAVSATTDEERTAALQEASAAVVEEALDVPLMFGAIPNAWSNHGVGVESYLNGKQEFRGVGVLAN